MNHPYFKTLSSEIQYLTANEIEDSLIAINIYENGGKVQKLALLRVKPLHDIADNHFTATHRFINQFLTSVDRNVISMKKLITTKALIHFHKGSPVRQVGRVITPTLKTIQHAIDIGVMALDKSITLTPTDYGNLGAFYLAMNSFGNVIHDGKYHTVRNCIPRNTAPLVVTKVVAILEYPAKVCLSDKKIRDTLRVDRLQVGHALSIKMTPASTSR